MRAGLYQTKKGLPVFSGSLRSEEVDHVRGDFLVHGLGPLQRQRAFVLAALVRLRAVGTRCRTAPGAAGVMQVPVRRVDRARYFGEARDRRVLAGRRNGLLGRGLVDVGEAHPLHGVQVIQVAPELLEAVRRRQRLGVVAQVVLAELAGV